MIKPFTPDSLRYPLFLLALGLSGHALTEEVEGLEVPQMPQEMYITPDKMTSEDRMLLSEYSGSYNSCLTGVSMQQMEVQADARNVVDYAMKECAVKLEELDQKMIERNFEPNFRMGYLHMVSNKGANNVLRSVMMGMATRPAPAEPASEAEAAPETTVPEVRQVTGPKPE